MANPNMAKLAISKYNINLISSSSLLKQRTKSEIESGHDHDQGEGGERPKGQRNTRVLRKVYRGEQNPIKFPIPAVELALGMPKINLDRIKISWVQGKGNLDSFKSTKAPGLTDRLREKKRGQEK